ncbi:MAG TPA: hypothetical protein VN610_02385, partial [Bryobacteraceae bacterium]|nr:hypothetical protein [Bryobacteraceae bacterium]
MPRAPEIRGLRYPLMQLGWATFGNSTADWSRRGYYEQSPVVDPPAVETGHIHVRRGGSWNAVGPASRSR